MAYPTPRGRKLGAEPLEDVWILFEAFVRRLCWAKERYPRERVPFYATDLCQFIPEVVRGIEQASGPVDIDLLAGSITMSIADEFDLSDMTEAQLDYFPAHIAADVWWGIIVPLGELGIFELNGMPAARSFSAPRPDRTAGITALGMYAAVRMLAASP
jgi:hypothetical protein